MTASDALPTWSNSTETITYPGEYWARFHWQRPTYPVANGRFNTDEGTDIIDAEWIDVGVEMRVDRWNTVWADIGQAYNKKVHCIEG